MDKGWYWKLGFVLVLVLFSVAFLLPSFVPEALPAWYKDIFSRKVNLGLDLQGGIHLVLGVEVDKALEDKADQYAGDFKDALKEKRIPFKRVSRLPGTFDLLFELENTDDLKKLEKRVLNTYFNLKKVSEEGSTLRVTFDEKFVEELRKNARDQCRMTVRNRVDEIGVAQPTIAPHGDVGILVQLPGEFDPERAKKLLGRTAQLVFKVVDDKSDFIKKYKDRLPQGVRMESYNYSGPNEEVVTEFFLVSRGKGNEGKNRLQDFFNNVSEIDAFLKSKSVDPKIAGRIVELLREGISDSERREIQTLARQAFGVTDAAPAGANTPEEKNTDVAAAAAPADAKAVPAPDGAPSAPVDEKKAEPAPATAATAALPPDYVEFERLLRGKVPDDREIGYSRTEQQLEVEYRTYYLHREVAMTGDYITDARVQMDPETGHPEVSLTFDRTGAVKFEKLTGAHVRERMAIVLEGEVSSAPVIQQRIAGGRARITLGSTRDYNSALTEANDLAAVLRAGALPAPVRILEERTVGPTMGEDARRQGSWALAIGTLLVVLFMVVYYGIFGLIADVALVLNAILILVCMVAFGATLTLPGIAGIVLTLGMAVDANVIINERIREELRAGKTPRAAVEAGYSRAFWTIFDANLTTLITAFVLMSYGSGPVQGFAVTLAIGLVVSMFTAIFVTRVLVDWLVAHRKAASISV
ncbi:MAG: protein translocase subunit SecD [Myxococcales bacterium]|nr:protein translocase subunit SecD [Myxococcales bacterium]